MKLGATILCTVLFFAGSATAQPLEDLDFLARSEREVSNYLFDELTRQTDASSQAGTQNVDEQIEVFGPTNPGGVVGEGEDAARQAELARRALPEADRLYDLTAVNPDQGITQTMESSTYNNMMSQSLSKNATIYLTTLNMVEPAVAAALGTSVQSGLQYYEQIMGAEAALTKQLDSAPELRDWVLQFYNNCISKRTTEFGGNRIRAQEECQKKFGPKDSPDHPDNLDVTFSDDDFVGPPAPGSARTSIPSADRENYIALTDLLFNQAINYRESLRSGSDELPYSDFATERQENAIQLKSSFIDYFGDYLIRVSMESGTEGAAGVKHSLRMVRIPPKRPAQQEMPIITEQIYDSLNAMMHQRCMMAWDTSVPAGLPGGPEGPPAPGSLGCRPGLSASAFKVEECSERWNAGISKEALREVSVPGFQPSAPFADMLWNAFTSINGVVQNNRVGCNLLDKSQTSIYINANMMRDGSASQIRQGISEYHRITFTVARRLARARMLGRFMHALRSVNAIAAAGSKDALAGRYATTLVQEAAGTTDIPAAYRENLAALEKYIAEYSKKFANSVGRSAESLRPDRIGGGSSAAGSIDGSTGGGS